MTPARYGRLCLAAVAFTALVVFPLPAAEHSPKRVLVLLPDLPGRPFASDIMGGLESGFLKDPAMPISVTAEHVGSLGFESGELAAARWDIFRREHAGRSYDLVIAFGSSVMASARPVVRSLWPSVPLVFAIETEARPEWVTGEVTGIFLPFDVAGTVKLARRLLPVSRHVALIGGSSPYDRQANRRAASEIRRTAPDLELLDLTGLRHDELKARLAALPPNTFGIGGLFAYDADGLPVNPRELGTAVFPASAAPIFELTTAGFGYGTAGGVLADYRRAGANTAALAVRVLRGERASSIPVKRGIATVMLDARELRKWKIPDERIPAGADVRFRRPSLWVQYRWYALAAVLAFALQSGLIAVLGLERRRRKASQRLLEDRLRFESLLFGISAALGDVAADLLDARIRKALGNMAAALELERVWFWSYDPVHGFALLQALPAGASESGPGAVRDTFPHLFGAVLKRRIAAVENLGALPAAAAVDSATLRSMGVKSFVAVPLSVDEELMGAMAFATCAREQLWPGHILAEFQTLGDVFANALARKRSELAVRAGEALNAAMLASLPGFVMMIDAQGRILRTNQRAGAVQAPWPVGAAPQSGNYFEGWRSEVPGPGDGRGRIESTVAAIAAGVQERAILEFGFHTGEGQRWIEIRARRVSGGGAVIAHLDVTARKHAEAEARRQLSAISHSNRVSSMGELATSLAHELTQPLAAILMNAEAVREYVASGDTEEARAALDDIYGDSRRAVHMLSSIRSFLRKRQTDPAAFDINDAVQEVSRMVAGDALARRVNINLDLAAALAPVFADIVEIEQVVLNLVSNAMEAVKDNPPENRSIVVRTRADADTGGIAIEVSDTGPGISDAAMPRLFDPFFTTRPDGLGMGLAISRSLVEAAGGQISAGAAAGGGAVFRVTLPPAAAPSIADASAAGKETS